MGGWLPVAQFIASTSVAVVGLVVAGVAALIGYGNAFGWKPLIFVRAHSLIPHENPDFIFIYVAFEVWNRRKYPVVIRGMEVRWKEIELKEVNSEDTEKKGRGWRVTKAYKVIERAGEYVIEPNGHRSFYAKVRFETQCDFDTLSNMRGRVRALIFDPRAGGHYVLETWSSKDQGTQLPWD